MLTHTLPDRPLVAPDFGKNAGCAPLRVTFSAFRPLSGETLRTGNLHDEGLTTLPQVLDELNVHEAILVGHSDGGSIAIINAGGVRDARVLGLILEAPHVFVEEFGLQSIRALAAEYRNGNLKARLERYHGENVDNAFWGWNHVWLDPEFKSWNIEEYLPRIELPALVIQGEDDQFQNYDGAGCTEGVRFCLIGI